MRIGFIARPRQDDFEFAALKGFPSVELVFHSDLSLLQRVNEINGWRQKFGAEIRTVGLFGRNYLTEKAGERQAHLDAVRQVTEFARTVGAKILTTGGGLNPALDSAASAQRTLELLAPAVQQAQGAGLQFAFANSHRENWVTGPAAWEPLLAALPHVGINFDPSHPVEAGEDWAGHLAAWGHRVVHVHARDTLFVGGKPFENVPAGLGEVEWGRLFALLYHHRYTGDISIDPHGRTWEGENFYCGVLLARQHLERYLPPPATAQPKDVIARA